MRCSLTEPGSREIRLQMDRPYAGMPLAQFRWIPKPMRKLSPPGLGLFGIVALNVYSLYFVIFLVFLAADHRSPVGHLVRLQTSRSVVATDIGIRPMLVRLQSKKFPDSPAVFVDGRLIPWLELGSTLKFGIRQRLPDWPIYLQADGEVDWKWVVQAIGVIHDLPAEVELLGRSSESVQDAF